ncbi:hypothetical protein ACN38_g299 [Penicillium nordicum]|uniref:Uncharacterized protein n=1 Tax=Penicillium nordicum TaxID=229535 RepID=A0A0M8PIA8_9EURO|nr:hypothetical protein ACN38_g299 [Penicillium nordicum]
MSRVARPSIRTTKYATRHITLWFILPGSNLDLFSLHKYHVESILFITRSLAGRWWWAVPRLVFKKAVINKAVRYNPMRELCVGWHT